MKKYKAVIFDMDGTLLDTLTDLRISLNHSLKVCGYAEHTEDEVRSYIGDGMGALILRALPDSLKPDESAEAEDFREINAACIKVGKEFRKFYIEHGEDNTRPYEGIVGLLTELKAQGVKTAVVSNKVQEAVERLCERLFKGLIDIAVGDREGVNLKPAPDMLLEALNILGVNREDAVFVGDGEADIIAAKKAELNCISVCYGYRTEEFLREKGGSVFAHDVRELSNLLKV